jgi:hypothetical protein
MHSVGLLWTRDPPVVDISTWQHTPLTRDRHPCPRRDSNPQSHQASGLKLLLRSVPTDFLSLKQFSSFVLSFTLWLLQNLTCCYEVQHDLSPKLFCRLATFNSWNHQYAAPRQHIWEHAWDATSFRFQNLNLISNDTSCVAFLQCNNFTRQLRGWITSTQTICIHTHIHTYTAFQIMTLQTYL